MDWLAAPDYWLARWLFERSLAVVYLIAFVAARNQNRALLGENGLLPIPRYVERVPFRAQPSLFHWRYTDGLMRAVAWTGIVLSAGVVLGLPQSLPTGVSMGTWLVIWALYLSIVNVGQVWYSFGWESILLEAGFLAIFLGDARTAPPIVTILLVRWLLFRVEFGAGLIKIRGDRCWRDLTCLDYHHETQPMPNWLSWFAHHLPKRWHRTEVLGNHLTQLVVPFALFAPHPVAPIAGGIIVVTQSWLVLSGNFAWLNALAIVLAIPAFGDGVLAAVLPVSPPPELGAPPVWLSVLVLLVAAVTLVLSWWPVRNMLSPRQAMNRSFNPFHLVGTYGAFGSVTKQRFEVVLEGTLDDDPGPDSRWLEYGFKGKPTDPARRPPQVAPYHLRLDWLLWFVPLSGVRSHPWLIRLVAKLLEADRDVLGLLRHDPFDGRAPTAIRARRFRYRFSTPEERRRTGAWWVREPAGEFLGVVTRDAF